MTGNTKYVYEYDDTRTTPKFGPAAEIKLVSARKEK
jgi:hypothetical protein